MTLAPRVRTALPVVAFVVIAMGCITADPATALPTVASTPGVWHASPPGIGRDGSAAIYDPVRDRVLVFGGRDATGAFHDDVLIYSPAGDAQVGLLPTVGPGPTARINPTAIYDPTHDRMVVFGGRTSSGPVNEVWSLSLSGRPTWSLITPQGAPPPMRERHTAIYDSRRHYMWVFGGYSPSAAFELSDTWAMTLDGTPIWAQFFPNGQPARSMAGHSAVYDAANDRMLVYGGKSGGVEYAWVWSLSFYTATWSMLDNGSGPPARSEHRAVVVYDAFGAYMLVSGGYLQYGGATNDVWVWNMGSNPRWTAYPPGTLPPARTSATMVYDDLRGRAVIIGGWNYGTLEDAWAIGSAGRAVYELTPPGTPPPGRAGHAVIYDAARRRMVMYGGFPNDLWAYDLETDGWSRMPASGTPPSRRSEHTAVYDPVRQRMIVFGGRNPGITTGDNELWQLTLGEEPPHWSTLPATGGPPAPRYDHSAIYDPVRDRMIVFGGFNNQGYVRDVWALSLSSVPTWSQIAPASVPTAVSARLGHTAIYDPVGDRMVVFGGDDNLDYGRGETWALLLGGAPTWTRVAPASGPPEQSGHTAIYDADRGRMVIFGGPNDTWVLSLGATPIWQSIEGPQPSVSGGRAIYDPEGDRMVMFGGYDAEGYRTTTWWLPWKGAVTSVPQAPAIGLALRGFEPNPARGVLETAFTLATQERATLELFDIAGRRLAVRDVGGLGPGSHRVTLAEDIPVRSGLYTLRLTQGGRMVVTRGVVLR
jgi:hypothetical protein